VTNFEYPPTDPTPFLHTTYDHRTGYLTADGQYCMPLGSQHQQNLVSDHAGCLRCDDPFDHYEPVTQHPILPIPPSSGSSELGNALVETSPPEPQPMSRASIALSPVSPSPPNRHPCMIPLSDTKANEAFYPIVLWPTRQIYSIVDAGQESVVCDFDTGSILSPNYFDRLLSSPLSRLPLRCRSSHTVLLILHDKTKETSGTKRETLIMPAGA
jgi:hypothetical protein